MDKGRNSVQENSPEEESPKNCFKCLKDFHLRCFRKDWKNLVITSAAVSLSKSKKCKIICDLCEKSIQSKMKVTRISDYFKPQKNSKGKADLLHLGKNSNKNINLWDCFSDDVSMDSTNIDGNKIKSKCNDAKFRLPKELTKEQKKILQESLYRALEVKEITFGDDLNYQDKDCPSSMNDASLEVGIQKISEYNKEIYYKFKKKTREAEYPPLEIVDDNIQVRKVLINYFTFCIFFFFSIFSIFIILNKF